MINFFNKMKGGRKSPPAVGLSEILWSWLGAFCGIMPVAFLNYNLFADTDLVFIIGSFGASAVLIYGAVKSPLAQPRNLMGGHIISAIIGVAAFKLFHNHLWFASSFAVATAIAEASQRLGKKHWYAATPTRAEKRWPPIKFLGCAKGLLIAP